MVAKSERFIKPFPFTHIDTSVAFVSVRSRDCMCNLISHGDHIRYHCIHKEHHADFQSLISTKDVIWRSLAFVVSKTTTHALSKEGYYHYMRFSTKKKIWLAKQSYHSENYHRHILMNWLEYRTDPIKSKKNRVSICF